MERQLLSRFLALSAEIRFAIYKLVTPDKFHIITRDEIRRFFKRHPRYFKIESTIPYSRLQDSQVLLRVHSVCHNEVAPLLYGCNRFYFRALQGGLDWVGQIGPRNASMIRELHACHWLDHNDGGSSAGRAMKNSIHRVLQPTEGLRSLTVCCVEAYMYANGIFTPCISFLRRARYLARQVPCLTRIYRHGRSLRFTDGEPDKDVSVSS
jgi:hypothetical protein